MQHHQDSHFQKAYGMVGTAHRLHHSPTHLRLHVNLDDATSANNDWQPVHASIDGKNSS